MFVQFQDAAVHVSQACYLDLVNVVMSALGNGTGVYMGVSKNLGPYFRPPIVGLLCWEGPQIYRNSHVAVAKNIHHDAMFRVRGGFCC